MKTLTLASGVSLHVGQNAQENQTLLEHFLHTEYLWFHLKDYPSCHVILEDEHPTQEDIDEAALVCKNHTKYRFLKYVKVSYTPCSNLIPTSVPGAVIFVSHKKVLSIIPCV